MKKWVFIIGLLALGVVIFNNVVQAVGIIELNTNYMIGLTISLIASILYGIINIK